MGSCRVVIDGKLTKFWKEKWIIKLSFVDIIQDWNVISNLEEWVCEYTNQQGEWDWPRLNVLFDASVNFRIVGYKVFEDGARKDLIYWAHTNSCDISIKSTCSSLYAHTWSREKESWKKIWKLPITQCVQAFLRLGNLKTFLTNKHH